MFTVIYGPTDVILNGSPDQLPDGQPAAAAVVADLRVCEMAAAIPAIPDGYFDLMLYVSADGWRLPGHGRQYARARSITRSESRSPLTAVSFSISRGVGGFKMIDVTVGTSARQVSGDIELRFNVTRHQQQEHE